MPVIRSALDRDFTQLPNATINDSRLSADELAVLIYLLSKPADWKIRSRDIRTRFSFGREKCQKVLAGLVQLGYLALEVHKVGNLNQGFDYWAYPQPRQPAPRESDFRAAEEPAPYKDRLNDKERGSSSSSLNRSDDAHTLDLGFFPPDSSPGSPRARQERPKFTKSEIDSMFAEFWAEYPNKVGKLSARQKFEAALKRHGADFQTILAALAAYKRDKPPERDWCHPTTWLNQGRWMDQPAPAVVDERGGMRHIDPTCGGLDSYGRSIDEIMGR